MNKYEAAKTLRLIKARIPTRCEACRAKIPKGAQYFRESLGLMAKPPGVRLRAFCMSCGKGDPSDA